MTVAQLLDFMSYGARVILKDAHNGRVYTKAKNYPDRIVTGIYPIIEPSRNKESANAVLVAWVKHDFEGDE